MRREVEAGFEPAYAALQAATWPLGHSTRIPRGIVFRWYLSDHTGTHPTSHGLSAAGRHPH